MRRILVVIDMKNDFIDGSLGTPEAQAIVPAVAAKIGTYSREDVYATKDTHPENYLETQEGRKLPVLHCVRETEGWNIRPEIAELLDPARVFEKPEQSTPPPPVTTASLPLKSNVRFIVSRPS